MYVIKSDNVDAYIGQRKSTIARIKNVLINQLNLPLGPNEISEDSQLFGLGLGLDSVDTLEIVLGLEKEFGVTISDNDMAAFRSINTLTDYVMENTSGN